MRIQDIMSRRVASVTSETAAETAWNLMQSRSIHHLVVTDGGRPVGVVSARDLGGRRGSGTRKGQTVAELMSASPVTARPETTLRQAANLMRGRAIGCLPVLDRGKLVGIVTVTDLLELIGRGHDRPPTRAQRGLMRGRPPGLRWRGGR